MRVSVAKSSKRGRLVLTFMAIFALLAQPMYGLVANQVAQATSASVGDETELRQALADRRTSINLSGNIGINNQISVDYSTTFNGGVIKSLTKGVYGSDDAVVYVSGSGTIFTANNTTFDGNNQGVGDFRRQGVKVYGGAEANFYDSKFINATKAGLHVNGTSVGYVKNVTTSNNGRFFGGLVVSGGGAISIDGKSTHSEALGWDARIDGSGTINDNSDQYTGSSIRRLKSAPLKPVITAPVSTVGASSATLTWNAPSTLANRNAAASYVITFNGNTYTTADTTFALSNLTDGTYTVAVQSIAKSGLVGGTATHTFTVSIPDTEAPVGIATYNGGYLAASGVRYVQKIEDLSFTASIIDNKDVARATYRAINVDPAKDEACGNWNANSLTNHNFTAPLQKEISYTVPGSSIKTCDESMKWETGSRYRFIHAAFDTAGNEGKFNVPNQQLIEIDRTEPVIQVITPLAGTVVKGIVPIKVKMTENGSGVKYVKALFTDGAVPEFGHTNLTLEEGSTDTYVGSIDTGGKSGKFSLGINTADNVGNTRSAKAQNIVINNKAPGAKIAVGSLSEGGFTKNTNITITGTGIPSVPYGTAIKTHFFELVTPGGKTYTIYNFKNSTNNICTLDGANVCSFQLGKYYDKNGLYKVRYVVTDEQGIRSDGFRQPWVQDAEVAEFSFSVDTIRPLVEGPINETGVTVYNPKEVTVTATDKNGSGVKSVTGNIYKKGSDGEFALLKSYSTSEVALAFDESVFSNLKDGEYYLRYNARDNADNISKTTSFYFTVDRTPPTIAITSTGPFSTETPTVTGIVSDDATGVEVSIDGGVSWIPATTFNQEGGAWSYTYTTALTDGSHTILARATDSAENTGTTNGGNPAVEAKQAFTVNTFVPTTPTTPTEPTVPTAPVVPTTAPTAPVVTLPATAIAPLIQPAVITPTTDAVETNEDTAVAGVSTENDTDGAARERGVLAAEDVKGDWSLANVLLTIAISAASLIVLLGAMGSKREERKFYSRVLTMVPAAIAIVALFMTSDFSANMIWFNSWTWLMATLVASQAIILGTSKTTKE